VIVDPQKDDTNDLKLHKHTDADMDNTDKLTLKLIKNKIENKCILLLHAANELIQSQQN